MSLAYWTYTHTLTVIIVIMKACLFLDALVLTVMLFLFYILFGKHSLCKFFEEETFTLEKKVDFDLENPPAITICARKQGNGWTQEIDPEYYFKEFQKLCDSTNTDDALSCIEQNTFDLNETIKEALILPSRKILDSSWDTDITLFAAGQSHTLNNSYTVGTDRTRMLRIVLAENNSYFIMFRDPQIFALNLNPETFPSAIINWNQTLV
jgi:hypothetical protein